MIALLVIAWVIPMAIIVFSYVVILVSVRKSFLEFGARTREERIRRKVRRNWTASNFKILLVAFNWLRKILVLFISLFFFSGKHNLPANDSRCFSKSYLSVCFFVSIKLDFIYQRSFSKSLHPSSLSSSKLSSFNFSSSLTFSYALFD